MTIPPPPPTLRTGKLCYWEIPARDVHQSAAFYERVFGWNIRFRETDRPSFDDTTCEVTGAWVLDRTPRADPRGRSGPGYQDGQASSTVPVVAQFDVGGGSNKASSAASGASNTRSHASRSMRRIG